MEKYSPNPIPDKSYDWALDTNDEFLRPFSGGAVQDFIKETFDKKIGHMYRSSVKEGEFYYVYGFESIDTYDEWVDEGQSPQSELILSRIQLPNIENDMYSVGLTTNSNTTKLVNLGDGIKINLRYTSIATNPTTLESHDTYNTGTIIINRSSNGGPFQEVGRILIEPKETTDPSYTEIDITRFLADGDNQLRIRVEDNVNGTISNNIIFKSIINTSLIVTNATDISRPLTQMNLLYYIQGQIAKTLHIKISDQDGNEDLFEFALGVNTYIEVPYTAVIDGEFESGVKTIEAWLTVNETTLESVHSIIQVYYITEGSDESVIILNNVSTEATNYTNFKFFDFTLYNSSSDVTVSITSGNSILFLQTIPNCQTEVLYTLTNTLEIESELKTIEATVTVSTKDMDTSYALTIDNSVDFSPVAGADFVLNPRNRSNSETNKNTIINDIDGQVISSTWNNFEFKNDGWVLDADGVKILRIPAGRSIAISYDAFTNLTQGTSIEFDFATSNIFNEDEVVMRIGEFTNNILHGWEMKSLEGYFMTTENQTKLDLDVLFAENTRTHIVINILPNVSGAGINYIRIFVNGIINREFVYQNTDIFKTVTPNITIGSNSNDIDIYGMRIYKMGLSSADIRLNYMSRIPDVDERILFKTNNDILSANGTISYDKAVNKFNCIVWKGQNLPSYSTGNVKFTGDLEIKLVDDLAHSGTITNLQCKGQGTSSRGYWKWNQGYSWTEDSVWTDGLGEEHTDGYKLTDDVPAALDLVGKVNWASSLQSHKIGATSLYNDLWKAIIGGNGITNTQGYEDCRIAVSEKPFLFFVQLGEATTPTFYSFMTFGSAKGDVPTFVGSEDEFPDYAMIEGADNGRPIILRQAPWITGELVWEDDKQETLLYAGNANIDFDLGNRESLPYFQNAFNFTYLHSLNLLPYNGDLEDINEDDTVDKSYQYWNTTTYDVYRYDHISKTWVNAGAEKLNNAYTVLNLVTQTGLTPVGTDELKNNAFKEWRTSDFKSNISTYYDVSDTLFTMAFCKMIAATDNRAKNTYEYLDPISHKIRLAQDDLDTIFATDNVGRKNKPYYVEEHTMNGTSYYWNGWDNVFYNLMETAFSTEYRAMMKSILTTMSSTEFGGNSEVCMNNYFFSVQKYFPAVAYNEVARLFYEEAAVAQKAGIYSNTTPAIVLSLGDQLQCELQWWNRRSIFMKSWGAASPFDVRSTDALLFRSILTTSSLSPTYQFTLTPYMWLYPKIGVGQSINSDNTLVPAGNTYDTVSMSADDDTDVFIYGANYYTDFGEFGGLSVGSTFNLSGNKLLQFSADSREVDSYQFRPTAMTVSCPVLRSLILYGCSTLSSGIDLSSSVKLEEFDARNTGITSITFASGSPLETALLPSTITSINFQNLLKLETFTIQNDGENIININVSDCPTIPFTFYQNWMENKITDDEYCNLEITGINWDDITVSDFISFIEHKDTFNSFVLKGTVTFDTQLTILLVNLIIDILGPNAFDADLDLHIVAVAKAYISGPSEVNEGETATFIGVKIPSSRTDTFVYSISGTGHHATINSSTGVLTAGTGYTTDATIEVKVTVNGTLFATTEVTIHKLTYPTSYSISGNTNVVVGENQYEAIPNIPGFSGGVSSYAWTISGDNVSIKTGTADKKICTVIVEDWNEVMSDATLSLTVTLSNGTILTATKSLHFLICHLTVNVAGLATGFSSIITVLCDGTTYNLNSGDSLDLKVGKSATISFSDITYDWHPYYVTPDPITFTTTDGNVTKSGTYDGKAQTIIVLDEDSQILNNLTFDFSWSLNGESGSVTGRSQSSGNFGSAPFATGMSYTLTIHKPGYVDAVKTGTITAVSTITLTMETAPAPFVIKNTSSAARTLTFTDATSGSIAFNVDYAVVDDWESYIYNWTNITAVTDISIPANKQLVLKSDTMHAWANSSHEGVSISFDGSGIEFDGSIAALVHNPTLDCFARLFYNETHITTAPVIDIDIPEEGCYEMFRGCTGLTTVPSNMLSSCRLSGEQACKNMFRGCTNLTNAPALPTTNLTVSCYYSMFEGCSSLTSSPALPATTLTTGCYYSMFKDCSSLTTAGAISATTLVSKNSDDQGCCQEMFRNCTSLTTAPDLLASSLKSGCYDDMFRGCSSLNYIKCLATNPSSSYSDKWVEGVASTGTFVALDLATWDTGTSGIPSGWTVLIQPSLMSTITIYNTTPASDPSQKITGDTVCTAANVRKSGVTALNNVIAWIRDNSHRYIGKYVDGLFTVAQLDDTDSTKYNSDGSAAPITTLGNDVFVKLPEFSWKCEETSTGSDIWNISFAKGNVGGWNHWDGNTFIGVYKTYEESNIPYSVSGKTFTGDVSQQDFKAHAASKDATYHLVTYEAHQIMCLLFYAYYGNTDSQAVCGKTYNLNYISGSSNTMGMSDSAASGSPCVNFWGLEQWWGGKCESIDNLKTGNNGMLIYLYNPGDDVFTDTPIRSITSYPNNKIIRLMIFGNNGDVIHKGYSYYDDISYTTYYADQIILVEGSNYIMFRSGYDVYIYDGISSLICDARNIDSISYGSRLICIPESYEEINKF